MARTDITLRADKGSALTFDEMDVNFSSFFYSASALVVDGGNKLRLFYTGSSQLDAPFNTPTYTEVVLPTAVQSTGGSATDPFGSNRQIQFNNNGVFGASSALVFTEDSGEGPRLGVGSNPSQTLDITSTYTGEPTIFNLNASSNTSNQNSKAFIQFRQGGSTFAQLGKRNTGNNDIDFYVKTKFNLGIHNYGSPTSISKKLSVTTSGVSIGNGINSSALSELSILGDITIGGSLTATEASYIGSSGDIGSDLLPAGSTTTGLLIQSPKSSQGGHVVVGINTDNNKHESFSIVKGVAGSYATNISPIATFKADGNVGINKKDPIEKLHVEGNITGSGNIQVEGSATIKGSATVKTIDERDYYSTGELKTLVAQPTTGTIQYVNAAPIPLGGIIMWSGDIDNLPTGWSLCDGNGGVQINGITIPDLRERFIVGAGGNNSSVTQTNGYDVNSTGGLNKKLIQTVNIPYMTTSEGGAHDHFTVKTGTRATSNNDSLRDGLSSRFNRPLAASGFDADSNVFDYELQTTSGVANGGKTSQENNHTHSVGTEFEDQEGFDVRPPYYALGFIIYVGV